MRTRLPILFQLPATLAILAFVPGNLMKFSGMLILWAVTFGRLRRREWIIGLAVCLFFTLMNIAALRQGIFSFKNPDLLGLPAYEFLMWGFYLLHTWRLIGGVAPRRPAAAAWILGLAYAIAFAAIPGANLLLAVTTGLLLLGLVLFHEPQDLAYVGYMILLGAAIEFTGVRSGQWFYPDHPAGGVPLWFLTLWGGVGLFFRRLLVPVLLRDETLPAAS